MSEVPEPWATRMVERGFTDRRSRHHIPSMGALADATGLHTTTVSDLIHGRRRPTATTVSALVDALGNDAARWLGAVHEGQWEPPPSAHFLTRRQRRVLEELIAVMTDQQQGGDDSATDTGSAAATSQPPDDLTTRRRSLKPQPGAEPEQFAASVMDDPPEDDDGDA